MKKYQTTGFWISLTGAVLLVLQNLGEAFGFKINSNLVNTIVSSVCGVLVVVGVLIPTKTTENTNEIVNENDKNNNTYQNIALNEKNINNENNSNDETV